MTARSRLNGQKVMDSHMQQMILKEMKMNASPVAKRAAFMLMDNREELPVDLLEDLYNSGDRELRIGVSLVLLNHKDGRSAIELANN